MEDLTYESIKEELKVFILKRWHNSTGVRLEALHDYEKVMRPRSPWDHFPKSS